VLLVRLAFMPIRMRAESKGDDAIGDRNIGDLAETENVWR